ncbi:MAG: hypothetical protein IJW74_00735 [Oscillospiraceae bacterium]|nr:hypothetical protein [Oscillospiraceae bacterium]
MENTNFLMESGIAASIIIAIVLLAAMITFAIFSGKLSLKKNKAQTDDEISANLIKTLKRFSNLRDIEVLEKTTLDFGGETFTFDAIVLSYHGTMAIKNCFAQGEIYGELKDEKWCAVDKDGKKTYFANPMNSTNGSVKFFKELYNAEKVKFGVNDAAVVFGAKDVQVYVNKRAEVYSVKSLEEKLSSDKYQMDKGADIPAMKAALEKYTVK